jgi:cytochrome P450
MVIRFTPAMGAAAAALVERWHNRRDRSLIDFRAEMTRLTLDTLVRTIFSDGLGDNPESVRESMATFFATAGQIDPFDVLGVPEFVPRITQWQTREMLHSFSQTLNAIITGRRSRLVEHAAEVPRDMLGVMLAAQDPETGKSMSDVEVQANVLTFIVAGQETMATAITWAMYLLSQSPEWYERITAECQRALNGPLDGIVDHLVETRAVIEEAMRLYPPIVGITRSAGCADQLAGRTIKKGTMVVVSPYVLHRHRLLWDDPDIFDPGRFLEGRARKVERYAYLPFGVGPRMCIGAAFALQEATLALATIVKSFTLTLAPGQTIWPLQRLTLRPRDAMLMIVEQK